MDKNKDKVQLDDELLDKVSGGEDGENEHIYTAYYCCNCGRSFWSAEETVCCCGSTNLIVRQVGIS